MGHLPALKTTPLQTSAVELSPPTKTALERVRELMALKEPHGRSQAALMAATLAEAA